MLKTIRPVSYLKFLKMSLQVGVLAWALIATGLLLRLQPKVTLVGVDSNGVRMITDENDQLLRSEKQNFVKKYLFYAYNYTHLDYDSRISKAGDMMSASLWEKKRPEFSRVSKKIKEMPLSQETRIREIRQVDANSFEVDLEIVVEQRLKRSTAKYRVEIFLKRAPRTEENPYQYEVSSYEEILLS